MLKSNNEMQESNTNRIQKVSKFEEGRLKLSTSCTECHRRKQKCDRQQPCRNCSRRFPVPACIYRTLDNATSVTDQRNPFSQVGYNQIAVPSTTSRNRNSPADNDGAESDHASGCGSSPESSADAAVAVSKLGPESYDDWSPSEYQNLVEAMVNQLVLSTPPEKSKSPPISNTRTSIAVDTSNSHGKDIYSSSSSSESVTPASPHHVSTPSKFSISSVDPLHFLGVTPTDQSGELLHAFIKVISKYVVSIDGKPSANYYNDVWVPWCMKSPLLAYFAIFTASCYQSETQKVSPQKSAVVLSYKLKTIELLNAMLRDKDTSTSIEALTAVGYIITSEWYWSNYDSVKAHLKGLKEMVRLRGGLGEMGVFSRKMIILIDYQIACSYDIDLTFPHNTATHVTYQAYVSTPWIYSLISFTRMQDQLNIAPETAAILDDMRYLQILTLKAIETAQFDSTKLASEAKWIQARIAALPSGAEERSPLLGDNIYKSCRTAALIYIRAILTYTPLSKACTLQDLNQLWSSMWRVTLTKWKKVPGIFVWIILSGLQAAQSTPHGRFLKSMFKAAVSYMSLDYFEVVDASLMNFVKMQTWLRTVRRDEAGNGETPQAADSLAYIHNYK